MVEGTKKEDWKSGEIGEGGCHCMFGHLGVKGSQKEEDWFEYNEQAADLENLMGGEARVGEPIDVSGPVILFNDSFSDDLLLRDAWLKKLNSL